MDIGTGIAIAGVWIFPSACALSKDVTSIGLYISLAAAAFMTSVLVAL